MRLNPGILTGLRFDRQAAADEPNTLFHTCQSKASFSPRGVDLKASAEILDHQHKFDVRQDII